MTLEEKLAAEAGTVKEVQIDMPVKATRAVERIEKKAKKKAPKELSGEAKGGLVDFDPTRRTLSRSAKRKRERAERKQRKERAARREAGDNAPEETAVPEDCTELPVKKPIVLSDRTEKRKPKQEKQEKEKKKVEALKKQVEEDPVMRDAKRQKTAEDVAKARVMGSSRGTDAPGAKEILSENTFASAALCDSLKNRLTELNFLTMTNIQRLGFTPLLNGEDALLRAPTGSGKTLAFAVPLIERLLKVGLEQGKLNRADGSRIVILSPTKELCHQTLAVVEQVTRPYPWIVCSAVSGGEKKKSEKARLRKGVTILCATPGRMLDHLNTSTSFNCSKLQALVLDEADRLLDLGFEKQIREIYGHLAKLTTIQNVLVSATLNPKVQKLAEFCLREGSQWIGTDAQEEQKYDIPATLKQWYIEVECKQRLSALIAAILGKTAPREGIAKKAMVFFSSCDSVNYHYDLFSAAEWPTQSPAGATRQVKKDDEDDEDLSADSKNRIFKDCPLYKLHGNLTAEERAGFMREFAAASRGVLLSTDVAARGLDIPKVDWIVQYDPPHEIEEYLHRVGRTARLGTAGHALLFLLPHETKYLEELKNHGAELSALDLAKTFHFGLKGRAGQTVCPPHLKTLRDLPTYLTGALTFQVAKAEELQTMARGAFLASQFAYKTFPRSMKHIFDYGELHLGHLAASYALKEAPKLIASKHKAQKLGTANSKIPVSKKDHADLRSKRQNEVKKVIKKDVKQGSIKSTKVKAAPRFKQFSASDEFAC